MNGKPVIEIPARTVINFESGFRKKLLCDGPTFSLGTACVYSCTFCYVPAAMRKTVKPLLDRLGRRHEDIVIRRAGAVDLLRAQLTISELPSPNSASRFTDPHDTRVIYASPLVDVAGNMELVRETVAACQAILTLTHWHIRLLSKSNLLPKVAGALVLWARDLGGDSLVAEVRRRMIFGVSTGTLDDRIAAAFEKGTALVSRRLASLHHLQDAGWRTFGMICPSLPLPEGAGGDPYRAFAVRMAAALRADQCEHVWAEVINVRGDALPATVGALRQAGFYHHATALQRVSTDPAAWEAYARATFAAHAPLYPPGKLRFLQYVTNPTRPFWETQQPAGAILL